MATRGLILGVDTIHHSRNPDIIRRRQVIVNSTDEQIKNLAITAQTINQAVIATLKPLTPANIRTAFDPEITKALFQAYQEKRVLDKIKLCSLIKEKKASGLSDALIDFLGEHGFTLPEETKQKLYPRPITFYTDYVDYHQIAKILHSAQVPVYFISSGIGPNEHYTWTVT